MKNPNSINLQKIPSSVYLAQHLSRLKEVHRGLFSLSGSLRFFNLSLNIEVYIKGVNRCIHINAVPDE
ncbi:MAG: hypothetical protein A2W85_10195 [Bacteroidetes bacterium GWF2_41_31]|nr:MAG: hypothetical protein A2W85_10195 [Bacteroidetes bacterium GWF2_41_31]OFZ06784.1 MAG: hypothetical protein A2338_08795 [Bacteroidetes bacterium RIFOXYB12_FULL_41_6]